MRTERPGVEPISIITGQMNSMMKNHYYYYHILCFTVSSLWINQKACFTPLRAKNKLPPRTGLHTVEP